MKKAQNGFTLLEMLLVMVILSAIILTMMRFTQQKTRQMQMDRMSLQMQQILNASLSFYLAEGHWPERLANLQPNYLPALLNNPWNKAYTILRSEERGGILYVYSAIPNTVGTGFSSALAQAISGTLPLSYTSSDGCIDKGECSAPPPTTACTAKSLFCGVVASVNMPGEDLNHANSVKFAGMYRHGGCVPVPSCPQGTTPQIFFAISQLAGTFDKDNTKALPLLAFSPYISNHGNPSLEPEDCVDHQTHLTCTNPDHPNLLYWRICLAVTTNRGNLNSGINTEWALHQGMVAFTRCALPNEGGSRFSEYE